MPDLNLSEVPIAFDARGVFDMSGTGPTLWDGRGGVAGDHFDRAGRAAGKVWFPRAGLLEQLRRRRRA